MIALVLLRDVFSRCQFPYCTQLPKHAKALTQHLVAEAENLKGQVAKI
jgi:hypothetical protein